MRKFFLSVYVFDFYCSPYSRRLFLILYLTLLVISLYLKAFEPTIFYFLSHHTTFVLYLTLRHTERSFTELFETLITLVAYFEGYLLPAIFL